MDNKKVNKNRKKVRVKKLPKIPHALYTCQVENGDAENILKHRIVVFC